uniref:SFRICE_022153 n=1 Tax=Spodoptera frugiperda TaxID=7108 RepID=A0A2H1VL79_SPOFR
MIGDLKTIGRSEVHIKARNTAIHCAPNFHPLCYKSHVIGGEPIAIYWAQFQTREKFSKNRKKSSKLIPIEPENPLDGSRTCNHATNKAAIYLITLHMEMSSTKICFLYGKMRAKNQ